MLGSWRGLERGGGEMGQSRSVMHKGTVVGGMWPFTKPWVAPDKRKVAWALSSLSAPDKPPPPHPQARLQASAETHMWPHTWIHHFETGSAQAAHPFPHHSLGRGPAVNCGASPRISLSPLRCHHLCSGKSVKAF